jgi:ADP-heptose:LPS heptosyltransferase
MQRNKIPKNKLKILILRFEHIGDVILITPFIHQLRKAFPDAEINVAIGAWAREILINNADITRTLYVNHPFFSRTRKISDYFSLAGFVIQSYFHRYNICFDPRSFIASSFIAWLIHAPVRIGFSDTHGKIFLNKTIPNRIELQEVNKNLSLLNYFNITYEVTRPIVTLTEKESEEAELLAKKMKLMDSITIFLHTYYAPWRSRELPKSTFHELIKLLLARIKLSKCVIVGSANDERSLGLREYFSNENRVIYQSDFTNSLRMLRGLFNYGRLFIGIDSGPMHLATCTAIPVLAVMGQWKYPRFAPYNYQDKSQCIVMRTEIDCTPCKQNIALQKCIIGDKTCKGLQQISAIDIANNAVALLAEKTRTL